MSAEFTTTAMPGWLDRPLQLAPRVSLVEGADGHPLLFDADSGTYVRLSRTGARLVPLLDGRRTGTALLEAASRSRGPDGVRDRTADLLSFLNDLRAAGVLSEPPEPLSGSRLLLFRLFRLVPHIRFPAEHLNRLLRPPAAVLARFPRTAWAVGALTAVTATIAIFQAMTLPYQTFFTSPPWLLMVGALLVQATVHEMGHATVCQALGVPAREAGLRLFLLLIPLTYVDRTDAYRVRSRAGRTAVALVGPLVDLAAAGLSSMLILAAPERFGELIWLLGLQMFVIITNLNPLLPFTDGHHVMEAALGEINLRNRAFSYLGHLLFRLPLPTAHRSISAARRRMYAVYALVSAVYLVLVLGMLLANYYRIIAHLTG